MMHRNCWVGKMLLVLGWIVLAAAPVQAVEEAQAFLDALRERGYFDTALDYIEWLRTSPLCPGRMKESLDYEAAMTNLTASLATQDPKYRIEYLDKARQQFEDFLQQHPLDPKSPDARLQLGNVLVERAKIKREQSAKPNVAAEEKKKLIEEARKLLEQARQVFGELDRYFTEEHAKFPKVIDPKRTKEIEARDEVRKHMVNARLCLATVEYEIAQTYPRGSKEYQEQMFTAARKFHDLYEKYNTWLAGIYALYWEARCYKEIGDTKSLETAQNICKELANQPDDPRPFRDIKNKSLILQLEMLQDKKDMKAVLEKAEEWIQSARGDEESSPEGLTIRFYAAEAARALMQEKKEKDPKLYNQVRDYYRFVSRFDGPHQMTARLRLRELTEGQGVQVSTYEEARDYGKAALDDLQAADLELRLAAGQGDLDPKKKEELEERIRTAQQEAKSYFVQALQLAAALPPERRKELLDELNTLRYYLAYLNYLSDDLYEAAILGEFLARKYPNSGGARPGAKIAMAAWVKLRSQVPKEADRSFETVRMTSLAEYIAGRWSGAVEAEDAMIMLLRSAVADQDTKKALEYLARLPANSSKKSEAEVLVGQALWSAYIRSGRLPEDQRPKPEELDQMREQAQKYLEQGIEGLRKQLTDQTPVDYTLASAVLSLAQIYVETGQSDKALAKLTDPQIGPVTLVEANHPVCERGNFRAEAYKAALRAYVAEKQLEKAEQTMDALEKLMASDQEGAAKLTQIYISLGLELEQQLNRLRQERKEDQAQQVLSGFELFLNRIAERPGNTFNSLYWVAETLQSLGAGFDPGTRIPPPDSKKYYEKAAAAYQKILEEVEEGKLEAPEGAHIGLQLRLAKCLRRLGQYKEALKWITLVLTEKPMMVDAQVEAAYICQAWGAEEPKYYIHAIRGGLKAKGKDGKEFILPIWGWGKMARMVQPRMSSDSTFRNIFHEARYNLALCRFEYAKTLSGEQRANVLKQAEEDIMIVWRLIPDMGGQEWLEKYNDLLKRIQQTQGKSPVGLPKSKPAPSPTAVSR